MLKKFIPGLVQEENQKTEKQDIFKQRGQLLKETKIEQLFALLSFLSHATSLHDPYTDF